MSKLTIKFDFENRSLVIKNMSDEDINGLHHVCSLIGRVDYEPRGFFDDLREAVCGSPIVSFRPDPVETGVKRVVVVKCYGMIFLIEDPTLKEMSIRCNRYRVWNSCGVPGWSSWLTSDNFHNNNSEYTILYDSANPAVGIPDGTEWVTRDCEVRWRMVGGVLKCWTSSGRTWRNASVTIPDIERDKHQRYNPDTTPYTPPDWLTALLNEKPLMEEGKFYSPTEKYNIGTTYRVNKDGTVSFWYEDGKRWNVSDYSVNAFAIRNGSKLKEVPDPRPCYIAADGRRIPVGSKFVYFLPQKHYADFTVEKTDGSGTWRTRSTGKVDPSMAMFNIESCLNALSCYTLELPK